MFSQPQRKSGSQFIDICCQSCYKYSMCKLIDPFRLGRRGRGGEEGRRGGEGEVEEGV